MLYKFIKKFKKVICLFVLLCMMIPIISACGENENSLPKSINNGIIGKGGNISAYTTYSQAKFMAMDRDMYYSYLVSMRDFILVVLPRGTKKEDEGYPDSNNLMFQAVYNGVTPYAKEIIDGNFTFENPEYKLLIYYVIADEFLRWEAEADEIADKGFIAKALDFLGPSSADNYDINVKIHNDKVKATVDANVVKNQEEYNLKNIVNVNRQVSECDFLRVDENYNIASYENVDDSTALTKCGRDGWYPKGKNVIADVANGDSEGLTLLFGSGGLSGYFTYEDVEEYEFKNVAWIRELLSGYNDDMETYIRFAMDKWVCKGSTVGICASSEMRAYAERMEFKLKYDLALLGRIKKINYYTLLDINASNKITTGTTEIKDVNTYAKIIEGDKSRNNGDYIAFTTAEGFIIDRGNIVMQAGEDLLLNTNVLEMLTQMDACTNRTLASYVAEALSTVGIVAGGIAVAAGAVAIAAYTLGSAAASVTTIATIGTVSLSVPGVGWAIGGALLVAAGIAALAYGITTKKAINDTDSANFCEVYQEAMKEIIDISYIKVPIYNYNIPLDSRTVELCYADYVTYKDANGKDKQGCGTIDDETKKFTSGPSVPAFTLANQEEVEQLKYLNGSPSVRLYSNGTPIDEIYGAASPQFVYAIMDSWGITAAASMKYYVSANAVDKQGDVTSFNIYDLLYADSKRTTTFTGAYYCVALKYGESCAKGDGSKGTKISNLTSYNSFSNGIYNMKVTEDFTTELNKLKSNQIENFKNENKFNNTKYSELKTRLSSLGNYNNITVESSGDSHSVTLNGSKYTILKDDVTKIIYLDNGSEKLEVKDKRFTQNGFEFSIEEVNGTYKIEFLQESIYTLIGDFIDLFGGTSSASEKFLNLQNELITAYNNNDKDTISGIADDLDARLSGVAYYEKGVPVYFTVDIYEKNSEGEEIITSSSAVYHTENIELIFRG